MDTIEQKVREGLEEVLERDISNISKDAILVDEVGIDSLQVLEVFGMMNEVFDITIEPKRLSDMTTISKIVNIVKEYKNS